MKSMSMPPRRVGNLLPTCKPPPLNRRAGNKLPTLRITAFSND